MGLSAGKRVSSRWAKAKSSSCPRLPLQELKRLIQVCADTDAARARGDEREEGFNCGGGFRHVGVVGKVKRAQPPKDPGSVPGSAHEADGGWVGGKEMRKDGVGEEYTCAPPSLVIFVN